MESIIEAEYKGGGAASPPHPLAFIVGGSAPHTIRKVGLRPPGTPGGQIRPLPDYGPKVGFCRKMFYKIVMRFAKWSENPNFHTISVRSFSI